MSFGNDIGYLGENPGSIYTSNVPIKRTQVYLATHGEDGLRTSNINRSFISFSFGGKLIEDFNLIACINGDRMHKQLHANFQDLISEYDVVDGQFYWGTYFTDNQISFTLSTDGITQNQLDDFKNWFSPGQTRELILSEHPNRAIMARVMEPPEMEVIPFEEETIIMVNTVEYETSVTVYKGEITLNLIMDSPFWYSKSNLLTTINSFNELIDLIEENGTNIYIHDDDTKIDYISNLDGSLKTIKFFNDDNGKFFVDIWADSNNNIISPIYKSKEGLKVILEDGIPVLSMIRDPMILGNSFVFDYLEQNSQIGYVILGEGVLGSTIEPIKKVGANFTFTRDESAYLYYAGTAPERPTIDFKLNFRSFSTDNNYIEFSCNKSQKLILRPPRILTEYRKTQELIINMYDANGHLKSKEIVNETRKQGNLKLTHPEIKKVFFKILDCCDLEIEGYNELSRLIWTLQEFFYKGNSAIDLWQFTFNFKNGEHRCILPCHSIKEDFEVLSFDNFIDTLDNSEVTYLEEDISDMIISPPIVLDERNTPDGKGIIQKQTNSNKNYSYKITHNFPTALVDFSVTYQNKYY